MGLKAETNVCRNSVVTLLIILSLLHIVAFYVMYFRYVEQYQDLRTIEHRLEVLEITIKK